MLKHTQLEHIITVQSEYQKLRDHAGEEPLPTCSPSDLAVLMYTSGTTGLPKACMLSHAYQINVARAYHEAGWVGTDERVYTALPLYHAAGQLTAMMTALYAGGDVVFPDRFRASRFMIDAAEHQATVVIGVMAMATAILATPTADDPPPWRGAEGHLGARSTLPTRIGLPSASVVVSPPRVTGSPKRRPSA